MFAAAVEFMEASSERCHRLLQDVQSCVQGGLWKAFEDCRACSACDSARVSTKISRAEATEALQDPQMSKGL